MKQKLIFLLMVTLLSGQTSLHAGACTGSSNCSACSNCSQCGHCAKRGGSCGVCENNESIVSPSPRKKDSSFWHPGWTWIIVGVLGLYIITNNSKKNK
ncbi:MAG: hypothetical protein ABW007_12970 [Chitinophagaceae bacterium]